MSQQRVFSGFLVSPIREQDSDARVEAENVFRSLIEPAIRNVEARRGIKIDLPVAWKPRHLGNIVFDIVKSITEKDVIVVIVADHNPNVLYEMGIAHSAGRELLLLFNSERFNDKSFFDVATENFIPYSSFSLYGRRSGSSVPKYPKSRVIADIEAALELAITKIEQDEIAGKKNMGRDAFGKFDALGSHNRVFRLYRRFKDLDPEQWADIFNQARTHIGLLGVDLEQVLDLQFPIPTGLLRPGESAIGAILKRKVLEDGVDVQILMMHEDNPALPGLLLEAIADGSDRAVNMVRGRIRSSFESWSAIGEDIEQDRGKYAAGARGSFSVVKIHRGVVGSRLTLTDQCVVVTPIFAHNKTNSAGPAFWFANTNSSAPLEQRDAGSNAYRFYRDGFNFLRDTNVRTQRRDVRTI